LQNSLLSICIPTFNRAEYLKNTLNSITGQEKIYESCEVIISDNNSTDNTRDIGEYFAEKFENVRRQEL
jgi:glycosyltransferase involved in cell wall biosynthesis